MLKLMMNCEVKIDIFWDVTPSDLVGRHQHFGGDCSLQSALKLEGNIPLKCRYPSSKLHIIPENNLYFHCHKNISSHTGQSYMFIFIRRTFDNYRQKCIKHLGRISN
jgi:hypothetical protein